MDLDARILLLVCLFGLTSQSPFGSHTSSSDRYNGPYASSQSETRHTRHRSYDRRDPLVHQPFFEHSRSDTDPRDDQHSPDYSYRSLEDPFRNKRQAFLPYFPYFSYAPPVYQVHNIYLTPPGYHCFPSRPGEAPTRAPESRPDPDLGTRLGGGDNGTETSGKQEPSKCVWSIVACCSPGSRDIRYACFELLGCPGAFWDVNPCDEKVVAAAANVALKFYTNNQAPTTEPTFQHL